MSYATGTTHYNLPQTVGTDKRDWFDTNQAFADIDTALFGAVQTAEQATSDLTTLAGRVTDTETDIAALQETVGTHGTQLSSLQSTVTQNTSNIADVRNDCEDMVTAYNEGSAATSTRTYAEGDYFIYNDVLYRATSAIAIGDTIVPNSNCVATNVTTELSGLSLRLVATSTGNGTKTRLDLFNELYTAYSSLDITDKAKSFIIFHNTADNTDTFFRPSGSTDIFMSFSAGSEIFLSQYMQFNNSCHRCVITPNDVSFTDNSNTVINTGATYKLYI